jgi:drug/metabolite transporter (DMT)-like permease
MRDLILSAVYFAFGFAATNLSFSGASAAFVETVKAAEPITSAMTAVLWRIEVLSREEGMSLLTIVAGVLLSTIGNSKGGDTSGGGAASHAKNTTLAESLSSCAIVMLANLCFSFRGLHQKLFRATPQGNKSAIDDLNLQYRMQQIGILVMLVPVLTWDSKILWNQLSFPSINLIGLSLLNGFAFTGYK